MASKKSSITDLIEQAKSLTPDQLKLVEGLLRVQQTSSLYRLLKWSFIVWSAFLITSFFWTPCDGWSQWTWGGWFTRAAIGFVDGVLGSGFRIVFKSLYPPSRQ